jgi:phosphoenolpyruvate carboxykinase (ATP)
VTLDLRAKSVVHNPSPEELQAMTADMAIAARTNFGNYNVTTRVVSRSAASTYVVTEDGGDMGGRYRGVQTISRSEWGRISALQDDHIAGRDMVVVDGYIGSDPSSRTRARLIIERAHANIAGMQRQLYYEGGAVEHGETDTCVIYTPTLPAEGYPDERLIAVDLEAGVTRVFNSDYFGESKKGGLRMWNNLVYNQGGLSMHAGCKVIPTDDGEKVALIVGLSGTGKTTTTFTRQNGSLPVQDDFIALMPGGRVSTTENGCFAKTFGLDPQFEPTIYGAVTTPQAYLENAGMQDGVVDFFDDSYTQNGRATFEFAAIEHFDPTALGTADILLILNRNENIIPAVARLRPEQAAAYFMLGETTGTSAGGAAEAGKFLRIPGTNPFFPMAHDHQGNRLLELLESHPLDVYLLNTGRVGGPESDERSKKVKIPHSSAVVKALAEGTITWTEDPDFGYEVATAVPGFPEGDGDLLRPRELYEAQGRTDEYEAWCARLKAERAEFLDRFPELDDRITKAIQ